MMGDILLAPHSPPSSLEKIISFYSPRTTLPSLSPVHMLKSQLAVPQNVTVCGDRAFKKVIKMKLGHLVEPSFNKTGFIMRKD